MSEAPTSATPLVTHLIELKRRVIRCVIVWGAAVAACYFFATRIYQFLLRPLDAALGADSGHTLIATSLTEPFVTYIHLAIYGGTFVTFPYMATELYLFIAPGLYKKERKALLPYLVCAPALFLTGAAMAYYFVMPKAWKFFVSFEIPGGTGSLPLTVEAKVSEYLSLVMQLIFAFGLAFQLPVILTLLVRVGFLKTQTLIKGRRYAVVILLTIAAFITPPDILSQILLFIPLYALYEISIVLARGIETRRTEAEKLRHA